MFTARLLSIYLPSEIIFYTPIIDSIIVRIILLFVLKENLNSFLGSAEDLAIIIIL